MLKELLKKNKIIDYLYICSRNIMMNENRQDFIDLYRGNNVLMMKEMGAKNPDKIIYLIDASKSYSSGFFSNLSMVLFSCAFAHDRGMYAVTYKNTPSHLNEFSLYRNSNHYFLYFFEQPDGITEMEAKMSCKVIKSLPAHYALYSEMPEKDQNSILVNEIRRSLRFRKDILEELEKNRKQLIGEKKILGVKYRGSDYMRHYNGHPVYVPIDEAIKKVKVIFEAGYDNIYLATEDENALKAFKDYFGHELIYDENIPRADLGQNHVDLASAGLIEHSAFLEGMNVLKDVWILSHASSFIGTRSGVTTFVRLFHEAWNLPRYQALQIIDKGTYKTGRNSLKDGNIRYRVKEKQSQRRN